jgi:hypothetical protein
MATRTNKGYYLGDGIYPPYVTFVKTIPDPEKRAYFSECKGFYVLQHRFVIVLCPAFIWPES